MDDGQPRKAALPFPIHRLLRFQVWQVVGAFFLIEVSISHHARFVKLQARRPKSGCAPASSWTPPRTLSLATQVWRRRAYMFCAAADESVLGCSTPTVPTPKQESGHRLRKCLQLVLDIPDISFLPALVLSIMVAVRPMLTAGFVLDVFLLFFFCSALLRPTLLLPAA